MTMMIIIIVIIIIFTALYELGEGFDFLLVIIQDDVFVCRIGFRPVIEGFFLPEAV